jgi:hypothetical protein
MDETGDRQSGTQTAHMDRQSLGSIGKMDNGLVAVSTLWADDARDYPRDAESYTPARRCLKGKTDAAFRTKPQMALQLIEAALEMGILIRAIMTDRGEDENPPVMEALVGKMSHRWSASSQLQGSGHPWTLCLRCRKPRGHCRGVARWKPTHGSQSRAFRDGHTEMGWAAEFVSGPYGPKRAVRRGVATTDAEPSPAAST